MGDPVSHDLFLNFELSKLSIPYPTAENLLILCVLFAIAVLSKKRAASTVLDRTQTDQLKGVAILLVVVGHLWTHVSEQRAFPVIADYAVTMFLFLSGFGLAKSYSRKVFVLKEFVIRRLCRVMIPYWISTGLFLFLDWQFLNRTYSGKMIMSTALGINVGTALMHIDYTRWYITLLLTFYLLFGITLTFARGKRASMVLLLLGIAVVALRIPKLFPFGTIDQILAFPLGCLFVSYESSLKTRLKEQAWSRTKGFTMTCLAMGFLSVICLVLGEAVTFGQKMAFSVIQSANGLLVCVFIVLLIDIFSRKGYKSKFLAFCGTISYELYLIHGPFLIKYNPVFGFFSAWAIAVAFLLLLVALMASSYGYHLINRWVTGKLLGNPALFGSK